MDLPLDDIIKSNRRGRGGRRGGNDNRTGGGAFRRARNSQRNNPYKSNRGGDRGNVEGIWEHDRFDDEEEEEEEEVYERPVRSLSSGGGLETGAKLQISNLAFGVSDDDIKDLFEPLGDIKKAFVHYDKKDGRSLGLATVIYARRPSALEAIKKYNNVPLDGQAMKITLVATTGGAGGAGGARRAVRGGDDGGVRSFRKAVNEAESFTIRVGGGGGGRGSRGTRQTGRRVVIGRRGGRGAGGGGGGRGGRGRGGRSGGRQVYVRY